MHDVTGAGPDDHNTAPAGPVVVATGRSVQNSPGGDPDGQVRKSVHLGVLGGRLSSTNSIYTQQYLYPTVFIPNNIYTQSPIYAQLQLCFDPCHNTVFMVQEWCPGGRSVVLNPITTRTRTRTRTLITRRRHRKSNPNPKPYPNPTNLNPNPNPPNSFYFIYFFIFLTKPY
jgi:hypothetical protein